MKLLIDFATFLPEPQFDVLSLAGNLANDLEWSYRIAREIIGDNYRRGETRYNERVVEQFYVRCFCSCPPAFLCDGVQSK